MRAFKRSNVYEIKR